MALPAVVLRTDGDDGQFVVIFHAKFGLSDAISQ